MSLLLAAGTVLANRAAAPATTGLATEVPDNPLHNTDRKQTKNNNSNGRSNKKTTEKNNNNIITTNDLKKNQRAKDSYRRNNGY